MHEILVAFSVFLDMEFVRQFYDTLDGCKFWVKFFTRHQNFGFMIYTLLADACHLNCDSDNRSEEQLM
ncbi:unnamed protein product [Rhizophagus irregularis]|nr:unnamed protein product [Rhizophagus irregularis]CAB5383490.1 unnamed protein product [Rhizophagus irregularis]